MAKRGKKIGRQASLPNRPSSEQLPAVKEPETTTDKALESNEVLPKTQGWIHRIPNLLKWASALATAATIAAGFGEYGMALVLLFACLTCCIVQIWVWQTNRHWSLKALLTVLSVGIIGYGVVVVMDQKDDKRWGVLWPKKSVVSAPPVLSDAAPSLESQRSALRNDSSKPIRDVGFSLKLNRRYSIEELGHFRIIYEVFDMSQRLDFFLACQSFYAVNEYFDPHAKQFGTRCTVQYRTAEKGNTFAAIPLMGAIKYSGLLSADHSVDKMEWSIDLYNQIPFYKTLEDLNRKNLYVFVTAPLTDKISEISFKVNNWELISAQAGILAFIEDKPIAPWIMPLSEAEKSVAWRGVYLKDLGGIAKNLPPDKRETVLVWSLDFASVHPKKLPEPEIKYDPLNPVKAN
jgi:hypothetical protein